MKRIVLIVVLGLWVAVAGRTVPAAEKVEASKGALESYVARPDASFKWVERRHGNQGAIEWVELTLTSQTWHDIVWKHQLYIARPKQVRDGSRALLIIAGGKWSDELEKPGQDAVGKLPPQGAAMVAIAEQLGTPVAVLLHVPQQPIFDGMIEDRAISYTFEQYLRTGDDTWPLLLPMVKSAVRGMDAVQQFAKQNWSLDIQQFTVTGASKRGWTTWLTAAVDPRVAALAPMVIDTLNMGPQMGHQLVTWGKFSDRIHDYTDRGIQKHLMSEPGQALVRIVDPYQYRDKLTQPKLIMLGTNDPYWPLDALNLYWQDLQGPKYVLYVPNQGHGLNDLARVAGTTVAFHRQAGGELKLANLTWDYGQVDGQTTLGIKSDVPPQSVSIWTASAPTRDFREAKWTSAPLEAKDGQYEYTLPAPESGYRALLGEAMYNTDALPYYLSTNVRIVAAKP